MVWTVKSIADAMNRLAPPTLAMDWDSVGLQLGSMETPVTKVFVSLDLTEQSLAEAMEHRPEMIVIHHPFLFSPLKSIRTDQPQGRMIRQLIQKDVSVFAAHTNMDIAQGGLNDWVAEKLALQSPSLLETTAAQALIKLVVFVPEDDADKVAESLAQAGAGHIGNYSHCSFRSRGTGTFKPLKGANPTIGKLNQLESVSEVRLETLLPQTNQQQAIQAMLQAHPYEEVAYDLIKLDQAGTIQGIGRKGKLPEPQSPIQFIETLKTLFHLNSLRWVKGRSAAINKVAVLTGSGASAIGTAAASGCDALITGDIKYHDAQEAEAQGLHIFDVGHFESEVCFVDIITTYLQQAVGNEKSPVKIIPAQRQKSPIQVV